MQNSDLCLKNPKKLKIVLKKKPFKKQTALVLKI